MARIYWTDVEQNAVARMAFDLWSKDTSRPQSDAVHKAQTLVLPPNRHRPIRNTVVHMPWIPLSFTKYMGMLQRGEKLDPLPALYEEPVPVEEEQIKATPVVNDVEPRHSAYAASVVKPLIVPEVEREYTPPPAPVAAPVSDLAAINTQDLIVELMTRMSELLNPEAMRAQMEKIANDAISARVSSLALIQKSTLDVSDVVDPSTPKHNPNQSTLTVRPKLRKVLIIGLLKKQEEMLSQEFPGIEFFFLSGMEGIRRLENTHKTVELTIKTNWIKGHIQTGGWKNLVHCNGFDAIRNQFKERFNMTPLR